MEYHVSLTAILILAILTALTAKHNLLTIPWIQVLRNPDYFGGWKEIRRGSLYLVSWSVSSLLIAFVITYILMNSTEFVRLLYKYVGYDNPSAGTPGLITITFINIAFYLYLVNKTKHVLRKEAKAPPPSDIESAEHQSEPDESDESTSNRIQFIPFILRKSYYLMPSLLAHIYRFFYFESSHLVVGAARMMFDDYDKDIILNFFESHTKRSKRSYIAKLSASLQEKNLEDYGRALALLVAKIELKGYYSTKKYIDNFIDMLCSDHHTRKDLRQFDRAFAKTPIHLEFSKGGNSYTGAIVQYSLDLGGLYIETQIPINKNCKVVLAMNGEAIEATVRNTKPLICCPHRRVIRGRGLLIDSEDHKRVLRNHLGQALAITGP
jgi:hypothetical protein